jgi:tetratricopeptide (TPR) repeat protein
MSKVTRTQLLVLTGALALTAVLYFAPQKIKQGESGEAGTENREPYSFESLLNSVKGSMKREELEPVSKLEDLVNKNQHDLILLDSLGKQWDRLEQPVISSHYFEMIAEQQPGEKSWLNAAYRYFDAFKTAGDSTLRVMMVNKAITAYGNVLSYNAGNLDAKTDLGVCYVEGTPEPMKGIMMLREVVSKNPEHENAQFNLGVLSVKSGQYDKAIERFQKVLQINPSRKEMYYMIGKSYILSGNKEKALENLEKLKKETTDLQLIEQTNSLISQININH